MLNLIRIMKVQMS